MWTYQGEKFTSEMMSGYVGFVYLITNHTKNKFYIGKKRFLRVQTYQKNKKKRKRKVESNWLEYTGSSDALNEDIKIGTDKYSGVMLHLCTSLGWMSYHETLEILQYEALQRDDFYNSWVSCKIHRKHLK